MSALISVFRGEVYRIFTVKPAFAVLVLGVAFYGIFYPQPYLNEVLRNVPIAVVDRDGTQSSRDFARRVDSTSDVRVLEVLPDLASAERAVFARRVSGILVIPQYFERELLHGRPSPVALYADASYFMLYQRVAGAVGAVVRATGAEIETARLVSIGVDPVIATAATNPLRLTAVPVFNPEGGYAAYALPAALVLILQQTLLMGVALLGTLRDSDPTAPRSCGERIPPLVVLAGKQLAYLALEAIILPFYLIVLPYLYGLPRLGSVLPILIFAIPFVLCVTGIGMVIARIFGKPVRVSMFLAAMGLPLFMMAGFAWPAEAIPQVVRMAALLVPSTSAIDGFVKLSQMGAPFSTVRPQILALFTLAIVYNLVALLQMIREERQFAAKERAVA